MKKELPFNETNLGENVFIRTFLEDTDSEDLLWHIDPEDRIIQSISESDWLIQLDNELPKPLTEEIFIPKYVYHRLIKGTGDLKIKLVKLI